MAVDPWVPWLIKVRFGVSQVSLACVGQALQWPRTACEGPAEGESVGVGRRP